MIHDSAASGYQRHSDTYAKIRPSYHPELMQRFKQLVASGSLVELGAGTGIFTRQLVAAGYSPIAIEPVPEMRAKLTDQLPDVDVREGTAEETHLETESANAVVVAQAFHWFDYPKALAEIQRLLVPGGLLICIWNVRDESVEWVRRYAAAVNQYEGNTPRHSTQAWRRAIESDVAFEFVGEWVVPNPQQTSVNGVIERALSTSFIAALEVDVQQRVLENVRGIVASLGDTFDFPYVSEMQVWRKK